MEQQEKRGNTQAGDNRKELLNQIIDLQAIGIVVFKAVRDHRKKVVDFEFEFANKKTIETFGYNPTGRLLTSMGSDGVEQLGAFRQAIKTGKRNSYTRKAKSGIVEGWFLFVNTPIDNERIVQIWEDFTDIKKAEQEIIELKEKIARKVTDKYQILFNTIAQGFCIIEIIEDNLGQPSDFRFVEVNPAFEANTGLKNVVGQLGSNLIPGADNYWLRIYSKVFKTGAPAQFENYQQQSGRWYAVNVLRLDGPESHQLAILFTDITEGKRLEQKREFLLKLSDTLRGITELVAIEETATRLTRDYFNADRCFYCTLTESYAAINRDSGAKGLPSIAGNYPLGNLPLFKKVISAGKPLVVTDVATSAELDSALSNKCIQLQIIAFIDIPIIKNGQPVGVFCLSYATPRQWLATEIELLQEVADRMWSAVERAKIEQALRIREKELTRVQEIGHVGGVDIAIGEQFTSWRSAEYLRLHGLPLHTTFETHDDWLKLLHPDDRQKANNTLLNALKGGQKRYVNEYRIIRPSDGIIRWIHAQLDIERDETGKAVRLIGAHTDITDQKTIELQLKNFNATLEEEVAERTTQLKHSKELLETAFNVSTNALVILSAVRNGEGTISDFKHEWLNETARRYVGENMIGKRMLEPFPFLRDWGLFEGLVTVVEQNEVLEVDKHYNQKGFNVWVHLKAVKMDDGVFVWLENISARKTAELQVQEHQEELEHKNTQLENSVAELESFNYVASHDLQEPLRKIQMLSKLIADRETNLSESSKNYFNHLNTAARQMQDLVTDLLSYSQSNSGLQNFKHTNLTLVLDEVKDELSELLKNNHATVIAEPLPVINAIPFQVKQVFTNLLTNSVKFAKAGLTPQIKVTCRKVAGTDAGGIAGKSYYHIAFADNGIGFDPRFNEQIFGLFKRLYDKTQYPGTGIGLAIVKKIMENHKGFATASGIKDKGTVINLYFPAEQV